MYKNKAYQAVVDRRIKEFDRWARECMEFERAEAATLAELPEFLASSNQFIREIAEEKLERFMKEE